MEQVARVDQVHVFVVDLLVDKRAVVGAMGQVTSSGWSGGHLAPRIYIDPPADGIWDFDFVASPPTGIALQVMLPIAGRWEGVPPSWFKGARVHAAQNDIAADVIAATPVSRTAGLAFADRPEVQHRIAIYDDSFQPTGTIHWSGGFPPTPHVEMKKLRHELTIVVSGPDEHKIRRCIDSSLQAGALAAIIAAFASGGWGAAQAFAGTAIAALETCLGEGFAAHLTDHSHWIYWDT